MEHEIHLDTPMDWLMEQYPQVIPTLVRRRMACIGCSMACFDTVAEAARYHHQNEMELLDELRAAAREKRTTPGDPVRKS